MTQRHKFVLFPTFTDQFSLFIHQVADYEVISDFSSKQRLKNEKMNTQKTDGSLKKVYTIVPKKYTKAINTE